MICWPNICESNLRKAGWEKEEGIKQCDWGLWAYFRLILYCILSLLLEQRALILEGLSTWALTCITLFKVPLNSIMMINSLQWICTQAFQCLGNTSIIISSSSVVSSMTWLQPPRKIAVWDQCRCGQIPFHLRGSIFFPKTQRWHQKFAFWYGSISQSQPAKATSCAGSPGVDSKQRPTQMWGVTASTLRNKMFLHLDRAKYGTMLNFILILPVLKEPWDASTNSTGWVPQHLYKYVCFNPNMTSLFQPRALGFLQLPSVSAYEFLLAFQAAEWINLLCAREYAFFFNGPPCFSRAYLTQPAKAFFTSPTKTYPASVWPLVTTQQGAGQAGLRTLRTPRSKMPSNLVTFD